MEEQEKEKVNYVKEVVEWILCILIAVVLALLVRHYIFTPTEVRQVSMKPTLIEGDRLILNKLAITMHKDFERGEIITFERPAIVNQTSSQIDQENPVAVYTEPEGLFAKFVYYGLEFGKESYIKRVIGLPGEHVLIEDGKVYINGEELVEDYLPEGRKTERKGGYYDFTVPEGYIFAMGDNRGDSTDCRSFGCIPMNKIESKVLFRFWPFNKFGKVN